MEKETSRIVIYVIIAIVIITFNIIVKSAKAKKKLVVNEQQKQNNKVESKQPLTEHIRNEKIRPRNVENKITFSENEQVKNVIKETKIFETKINNNSEFKNRYFSEKKSKKSNYNELQKAIIYYELFKPLE